MFVFCRDRISIFQNVFKRKKTSVNPFFEKIPLDCQTDYYSDLQEFLVEKWKIRIRNNTDEFEMNYDIFYFCCAENTLG